MTNYTICLINLHDENVIRLQDEYNQSGKDTSHETPQIDIGLELSVLHAKLSDVLSKVYLNTLF